MTCQGRGIGKAVVRREPVGMDDFEEQTPVPAQPPTEKPYSVRALPSTTRFGAINGRSERISYKYIRAEVKVGGGRWCRLHRLTRLERCNRGLILWSGTSKRRIS